MHGGLKWHVASPGGSWLCRSLDRKYIQAMSIRRYLYTCSSIFECTSATLALIRVADYSPKYSITTLCMDLGIRKSGHEAAYIGSSMTHVLISEAYSMQISRHDYTPVLFVTFSLPTVHSRAFLVTESPIFFFWRRSLLPVPKLKDDAREG